MADNLKSNSTSNSTFEAYFRQFVIYVAKNPYEFLSYLFIILTPLMLICGILSWKLIQLMEQEKRDKKRKAIKKCPLQIGEEREGIKNTNAAKTRRKKAKPE